MLACDMTDGCGATADEPCAPGCPSLATDDAATGAVDLAVVTAAAAGALDATSPEHDRVVALAVRHARPATVQRTNLAGAVAAGARLAYAASLREIDAERFDLDTVSDDLTYVVDRWRGGWPVDSYQTARDAEINTNRRNTRNIRDGQAHLRAALAAL